MFGLQFETYGVGVLHAAIARLHAQRERLFPPCQRCQGRGEVGHVAFPVCCPRCEGSGREVARG